MEPPNPSVERSAFLNSYLGGSKNETPQYMGMFDFPTAALKFIVVLLISWYIYICIHLSLKKVDFDIFSFPLSLTIGSRGDTTAKKTNSNSEENGYVFHMWIYIYFHAICEIISVTHYVQQLSLKNIQSWLYTKGFIWFLFFWNSTI